MANDIDFKKMREALSEYGSLEKAVQGLQARKRQLESEIAGLLAAKAERHKEVASLENKKAGLSAAIRDLDAKLEKQRWQYRLFTGFMALVTAQESKDIVQFVATAREWETVSITDPVSARGRIMKQLMGSVVKFFRCSSCGTRFLLDRAPQRPREKPRCPACSSWLDAEPDDSLLKLFLSSEQAREMSEVEKLRAEVERLKPAEVFLDIPCAVCDKPLPNTCRRDTVEKFFRARGLAHPECWKTPAGQLLQWGMVRKALSEH